MKITVTIIMAEWVMECVVIGNCSTAAEYLPGLRILSNQPKTQHTLLLQLWSAITVMHQIIHESLNGRTCPSCSYWLFPYRHLVAEVICQHCVKKTIKCEDVFGTLPWSVPGLIHIKINQQNLWHCDIDYHKNHFEK